MSIYGEVYGGKNSKKSVCFKSTVKKRRCDSVIDSKNVGDDSVDLTCVGW